MIHLAPIFNHSDINVASPSVTLANFAWIAIIGVVFFATSAVVAETSTVGSRLNDLLQHEKQEPHAKEKSSYMDSCNAKKAFYCIWRLQNAVTFKSAIFDRS